MANEWSLDELADSTGLSASFLSLVENGKSDISVGRLARLMDSLGVSFADFMTVGSTSEQESVLKYSVLRRSERVHWASDSGVEIVILLRSEKLDLDRVLMTFEPGASVEMADFELLRRGESFYLMLKGSLEIEFKDGTKVTIRAGDSLTMAYGDARRCWNPGRSKTEVYLDLPAH